jgi:MATE family multidrug resistance protein
MSNSTHTSEFWPRWKTLLAVAWPLIVANSFWNIQLTIDRVFLGNFSTEALGAAMAVMGVFWVPMALLQGTANYVMTFVAQYFGAKEYDKIGAAVWQSLYVSLFGGLTFFLLILFSGPFFDLVGHSPQVQALEVDYFNSLTFTALPTALVAAVSGFFTGLRRTRTVIGINLIGMLLNALLDWLLIFGNWGFPQLGIAGAGYATAIATFGAAIYGLVLLFRSQHERDFQMFSAWRLNLDLLKRFLKYGFPSGLQWAFEGLAFTVFLIIMGHMSDGDAALAASSIGVTVMMLSVLPTMGVAQAVMTLSGQHLGEKKPDEAARVTWDGVQISCIYMLVMAVSFFAIPEFYLNWFKNEQNQALWSQVSVFAAQILKLVAIFTTLDSIYLNVSFALKGAGDTRFVSALALVLPWPTFVLPTYLTRTHEHGLILSWAYVAIYSLVICSVLIWRFRQGRWRSMSVIGPNA